MMDTVYSFGVFGHIPCKTCQNPRMEDIFLKSQLIFAFGLKRQKYKKQGNGRGKSNSFSTAFKSTTKTANQTMKPFIAFALLGALASVGQAARRDRARHDLTLAADRSGCMKIGEGDCDWNSDCCDGLKCDYDWGWKTDYCVAGAETK